MSVYAAWGDIGDKPGGFTAGGLSVARSGPGTTGRAGAVTGWLPVRRGGAGRCGRVRMTRRGNGRSEGARAAVSLEEGGEGGGDGVVGPARRGAGVGRTRAG